MEKSIKYFSLDDHQTRCNVHRHQFLEQKFGCVGQLDLGDLENVKIKFIESSKEKISNNSPVSYSCIPCTQTYYSSNWQ